MNLKVLLLIIVTVFGLAGCQPQKDKQAALDHLCAYEKQLMVLNDGMAVFKDISMQGTYRMANTNDTAVRGLIADSMMAADIAFTKVLDKSIADMKEIKTIEDKTRLRDRSVYELQGMNAFCKTELRRYCMQAKDSLGTNPDWTKKWMDSFGHIGATGRVFTEYQVSFANEFNLGDDDYKEVMKCVDGK